MVKRHPFRSLGAVVGAAFVFFMLSASGHPGSYWANGPEWLGNIGWFAFLLCLLAFIGLAIYLPIAKRRERRRAGAIA